MCLLYHDKYDFSNNMSPMRPQTNVQMIILGYCKSTTLKNYKKCNNSLMPLGCYSFNRNLMFWDTNCVFLSPVSVPLK